MSFEYLPVSLRHWTQQFSRSPFCRMTSWLLCVLNLGKQTFNFTKILLVTLHNNFRLLFRIDFQILWYQFWNIVIQFTKKYMDLSLFPKMFVCHSCGNGGISVWKSWHQTVTKLHETERLFQKCVQLYLNYKLSINFVTRCQLFAEKT